MAKSQAVKSLEVGDAAPDFNLPEAGGNGVSLSSLRGSNVVLYFYPKDNTSGCTKESIAFSENRKAFDEAATVIVGISADSVASHDRLIAKHNLNLRLASDSEKQVIEAYGVWVEKNMYGRKFMGIERATYLIGRDGIIVQIWRKVRVNGHVEKVLAAVRELT